MFLAVVIVYNDSIIRFKVLSCKVYIHTMKPKKLTNKGTVLSAAMILITGIMITLTGVLSHQSVLRMIPLYVSLAVGILQSRANRYANLIGGINALLYAFFILPVFNFQNRIPNFAQSPMLLGDRKEQRFLAASAQVSCASRSKQ